MSDLAVDINSTPLPRARSTGYDAGMAHPPASAGSPGRTSLAPRVLLVTPPMVQVNTPYPATAVLAGFLQDQGIETAQADLSLGLALRLFSGQGLRQMEAEIRSRRAGRLTPSVRHFLRHADVYGQTVERVVAFLQGRDPSAARAIVARNWLPEGPRFQETGDRDQETVSAQGLSAHAPFGPAGIHDRAQHLASLYLDDLADAIREGVDARFGFARYADHLAVAARRFDPLLQDLEGRPSPLDRMIDALTEETLTAHRPALVGLTVPFPGTLYGALRIARRIRQLQPRTRIVLGGGYVNTELREMDDPRVFDYVDCITFDDGEEPLLRIVRSVRQRGGDSARKQAGIPALVRTAMRLRGQVVRVGFEENRRCQTPPTIPRYEQLPLDSYISMAESPNPMLRLWSDNRWLKVQVAHGCYWHRCRFCDTSLDSIGRYAAPSADDVVDGLETLRRRTGLSGFHFTDEALSPGLLRRVAERMVARKTRFTWWGNIRLEPAFTPELAALLARAGCVAVTGGLECANDRLLALMDKGVTVRGAARACRAFADAGIRVHLYLMYGFPTQTPRETIDGLEVVRRLFAAGVVQSAYWHRFALTCHSPIAADPEAFGIRIRQPRATPKRTFARNELDYDAIPVRRSGRSSRGPSALDLQTLGAGLRRAVYNYMLGIGLEEPAGAWFGAGSRISLP